MSQLTTHASRCLVLAAMLALASCGGGPRELTEDVAAGGTGGEAALTLADHAVAAVSADPATAERAISALRSAGPAGHAALLSAHADAITTLRDAPPTATDAASERLRHAVDVVSGQRDGHASGLYWHTDLASAQREARETGRPILSLRLLGRLDEEMSCANSRYFRLVLYPNRQVSALLRERYVLHWSSERPVPRITIDMGDGRRLERTITGNSIHYVLDASGRVLDALPGLYGPREMLLFLAQAEEPMRRTPARARARRGAPARRRSRRSRTRRCVAWASPSGWRVRRSRRSPSTSRPTACPGCRRRSRRCRSR